ncbi:MAG: recombinase family protein [Clostridiaceae bacterium]|nr:recombinase family protein [Clostridiaceae bacterium]
MARYGYMLLDQADADVSRQAMQLDSIGGFDRIFVDRHLRENSGREQRDRLIALLQQGDVVYAAAADRFCDHLRDFLNCQHQIAASGADIVLLQENLDSRTNAGHQTIRVLQAFDRLDFSYQSDRKKAGIRQARADGRRIGRPPVSIPPGFREICRAWAEGKINGQEAARRSGLRSTSFYKKAAELGFQAPSRRKKM